jgi:hypothetical protein
VLLSLLLLASFNRRNFQMNRLACLRLSERCANLLLSIVQEVHEMGDKVEKEMKEPLEKLVQYLLCLSIPCWVLICRVGLSPKFVTCSSSRPTDLS